MAKYKNLIDVGNLNIDNNTLTIDCVNNRVGIGTGLPSKALSVVGDAVFDGPTQTISIAGAGRVGATINLDSNYSWEAGYTSGDYLGAVLFNTADTSGNGAGVGAAIRSMVVDPYGRYSLDFHTTGTDATEGDDALRMRITNQGDIQFVGSAGSLHWESSTSRLGIGTGLPATDVHLLTSGSTAQLRVESGLGNYTQLNANGLSNYQTSMDFDSVSHYIYKVSGSEKMRLTSSGDVGIGIEPANNSKLHIKNSGTQRYAIEVTASDGSNMAGIWEDVNGNGELYVSDAGGSTVVRLGPSISYICSGNVGIGTSTNLQGKLDVDGDLRVTANIVSNTVHEMISLGSDRSIDDYGGLYKDYWRLRVATPGPTTTGESAAHAYGDLRFTGVTGNNSTYSDRMTIRYNGNVGIGVTVPTATLHVERASGTTQYMALFRNSTTATPYTVMIQEPSGAATGYPLLNVANGDASISYLRVNSGNGHVGIGKSPSLTYGTDIVGDVNITGTYYINGSPFAGGASQWSTTGSDIYFWNQVGIGTDAIDPQNVLHLKDTTNGYVGIRMEGSGSYNHNWSIYASGDGSGNEFLGIYDATQSLYRLKINELGNIAIGVTPNENWLTSWRVIEIGAGSGLGGTIFTNNGGVSGQIGIGQNWYYNQSDGNNKYVYTAPASDYIQYNGTHQWRTAPSGTSGNNVTLTQKMFINSDGNVAIGDHVPSTLLHLLGSSSSTNTEIRIEHSSSTDPATATIRFKRDSADFAYIGGAAAAISGASTTDLGLTVPSGKNIVFGTNSAERMRITSSGDVGIGEDNPIVKLSVRDYSTNTTPTNFIRPAANAGIRISNEQSETGSFAGLSLISRNTGSVTQSVDLLSVSNGTGNTPDFVITQQLLTSDQTDASREVLRIDSLGDFFLRTGSLYLDGSENLYLGDTSLNGSSAINFQSTNSNTNWQIRQNNIVSGDLTITPSTAAGGTTFTTPTMSFVGSRVGIGVNNPNSSYKLDISGDVNITGTYYANGSPIGGGGNPWSTSGSDIYFLNNISVGTSDISEGIRLCGRIVNQHTSNGSAATLWQKLILDNSSSITSKSYQGVINVSLANDAASADLEGITQNQWTGIDFVGVCSVAGSHGGGFTGARIAVQYPCMAQDGSAVLNSDFVFLPDNTSNNLFEAMRIVGSTGNVGIGTDAPNAPLDISKTQTLGYSETTDQRSSARLIVRNNNETAEDFSSISFVTGGGNQAEWSINNVYKSAYNGDLAFKTRAGGSEWRERMRLANNGNIGIGVDTPTTENGKVLHINADVANTQSRLHMTNVATGTTDTDGFYITVLGDESGSSSGQVHFQNHESNDMKFVFGSGGSAKCRFTVNCDGHVGIGTPHVPNYMFSVYNDHDQTITKTAEICTHFGEPAAAGSGTVTAYCKTLELYSTYVCIPTGVVDNGYRIGLGIQSYINNSQFVGTLKDVYGVWARAGSNTTNPTGTICCAISVKIDTLKGANTTINHQYGIYQSGDNDEAKNYFANRVGIGSTEPCCVCLEVSKASSITSFTSGGHNVLQISNPDTTACNMASISFWDGDATNPFGHATITARFCRNNMATDLMFSTRDTTGGSQIRMRLDKFGSLLVGTNAVGLCTGSLVAKCCAALQVMNTGTSDATPGISVTRFCNDTFGAYISLSKSRSNTVGTLSYPLSGDTIGVVSFDAACPTGQIIAPVAQITSKAADNHADTAGGGSLEFYTDQRGNGAGNLLQRMCIHDQGAVYFRDGGVASTHKVIIAGDQDLSTIADTPSPTGQPLVVARDTGTDVSIATGGNICVNSGYGVVFGANGEVLDSYEEGNWTPTIYGTISNPTVTYAVACGRYTKIGDVVFLSGYVFVTAGNLSGGDGNIQIGNLPFNVRNGVDGAYQALPLGYARANGAAILADTTETHPRLQPTSTTRLSLYGTNKSNWGSGIYEISFFGTLKTA